jgi:hypothetical protein
MSLTTFAFEISNGAAWVNLNDHTNYQIGGEAMSETSVERRRIMASSPVIEGEFEIHSVRGNVTEQVPVWVYGATHAVVAANFAQLVTLFSQTTYQIRIRLNNSRETWTCFSADYSLGRGQAFSHNGRALFNAQVPRLPAVSYEVI